MLRKNKKTRILQFPIGNTKGGITKYSLNNWKYIDHKRFQFDFATMSNFLDFEDKLKAEGCKVFYIKNYAEDNKKRFNDEFRKILHDGKYDVVHLHTSFWKSMDAEMLAREEHVPRIIVHAHSSKVLNNNNSDEGDEAARLKHTEVQSSLTDEIATDYWTCSREAAEFLFGNKISNAKIRLMRNAVDVKKYAFDYEKRDKIRKKYRIPDDCFLIGHIGRLAALKNHEFLFRIVKEMIDKHPKIKLMVVGNGDMENSYKSMVRDLGIERNVFFAGYQEKTEDFLSAFDLFAFPSKIEGLSLALIEAQASGVQCIVSDQVSVESKVSSVLTFCPLHEVEWINEIEKRISSNIEHFDTYEEIKSAGYDIYNEIKNVEKGYLGEL